MRILTALFIVSLFTLVSCKDNPKEIPQKVNKLTAEASSPPSKQVPIMNKYLKDLDTDYCMGLFEPKSHDAFVLIPKHYADREGLYLHKETLSAFVKMFDAAQKDGLALQIRSATRNFNYQRGIWERKWTGASILSDGTNVAKDIKSPVVKALKILEYSSMPGTSRHHWGTDIDLNAFNNSYFEKGEGKRIYDWLLKHASDFGFCQPYTPKGPNRPNGYNEEKWHWTYLPLSKDITTFAERHLRNEMISNFKGSETAVEIDVVGKYVLGIHQGCR
ncbi:MAG: M15 family metallopeptidase [Saprospiraceae bacterium]|nr:M15 family metallopeptidase [Saprospiraceae bacterium]